LQEYPETILALNRVIGDRLVQTNTYRAEAAGYDVERRLARALLHQAERSRDWERDQPVVRLRQKHLAMLIGANEGPVQKALNGPALRELVVCDRGRVLLRDVHGLARLAGMEPPAQRWRPVPG
jgi:CRP-like cAMP-binding protein